MPRQPRITLPGITQHVVQRGNDRRRTFFDESDFQAYLLILRRVSQRYETRIHAYALMSNHVHLLMTSQHTSGISLTMQQTGSCYVRRINSRYKRTGTLWEGRFRSSPVASDSYCLACYRYIELNPVRAGLVAHPEEYRWTSHRENIGKRALSIVHPHPTFLALAASSANRVERYRALFDDQLPSAVLTKIREGTTSGRPIGNENFRLEIEERLGVRIGRRRRGRPRRQSAAPGHQKGL